MLSVHQTETIAVGAYGEFDHLGCRNDILEAIEAEQKRQEEHDGNVGFRRPNFWILFEELNGEGLFEDGGELRLYSRYDIHKEQDYQHGVDRDELLEDHDALYERMVAGEQDRDFAADVLDRLFRSDDEQYTIRDLEDWVDDNLAVGEVNCRTCGQEIT